MMRKKEDYMRSVTLFAGIGLTMLSAAGASAATVTYNFDTTTAPQNYFNGKYFTNTMPALTPDIGDATQKATVNIIDPIDTTQALQLESAAGVGFVPPLAPGLVLQSIQDSSTVLRLTFTRPIYTVNFDFAVAAANFFSPPVDPNSLVVSAYATSGSTTPIASNSSGGGPYNSSFGEYMGHLSLSSAVSFSTLSFGLSNTSLGDTYILDNIAVSDDAPVVPEPGAIALGLALAAPAAWQVRKRKRAR